eukprot:c8731_g1_i1.p1 GENE.c8731_g1_i1~~c8731_g1_i1.p1  ORF type:complete len:358 (-),score=46.47 c8731_g1_i1:15-1007(-)
MVLTSPEFDDFQLIPGDYGCDIVTGEDRDPHKPSPPLKWYRAPSKTKSFVLMVDDMDADGFVHWLVTDIPRNVSELEADASGVAMPEGSKELLNSLGEYGWTGPCPLDERHRYRFRIFAMDTPQTELKLPNGTYLTASFVTPQLEHALYVSVLSGDYYTPRFHPIREVPSSQPPVIIISEPSPQPVPIMRYFKPSESFKKLGKYSGVYDNSVYVKCRRGELSAQLCRQLEPTQPSPPVIRAPYFPAKQDINEPRTISTDEASELSPEEKLRRHVRPGGLEPINSSRAGVSGVIVPIQAEPNVAPEYKIDQKFETEATGTMPQTDCHDKTK